MTNINKKIVLLLLPLFFSGCASYRTSSNVDDLPKTSVSSKTVELYLPGTEPKRPYKTYQLIDVSISKLTIFHADPTRELANQELISRAAALGCDGVINIQYQSGIGMMTWGYIDARGDCIKFTN
jgi:hypothetical protein